MEAPPRDDSQGKEKHRFLDNMSHEIRTPMNAIIGMIDLVLATELNSRQRRQLSAARMAADRLTQLLSDIIEYSKADNGKLEDAAMPIEVRRLVHEVSELFEAEMQRKDLQFSLSVEADVPMRVVGDGFHLKRVLMALLDNAIKFSFDGGVELRVSLVSIDGQQVELRCDVADTGIGMRRDQLQKMSELFSQSEESLNRRFGGVGLGLALSTSLVRRMGGHLSIESELGLGTLVSVVLPFTRDN